ncbi:MAG: hypothetical protein CMC69_01330 [Flavobacteriaceae bacterium]|nr:hypothetical protein [Flavobacteriaceae bacterium]|tara:strand:+ start:376 stop:1494 length:1119 start_codon:yes stop_codon:yes gene_type:complete
MAELPPDPDGLGTLQEWTTDDPVDAPWKYSDLNSQSLDFLKYPLSRSPSDGEDSLLIKAIKYVKPEDESGLDIKLYNDTADGGRDYEIKYDAKGKPTNIGSNTGVEFVNDDFTTVLQKNFKTNLKYFVELPIPQQISDVTSVTWGADTLNVFELAGLAAGRFALGQQDKSKRQKEMLEIITGKIQLPGLSDNARNAFGASLAGLALNELGTNVTADSILSRATGQIMNSNLELLFQGVNLRSFPFDMTFAPRNRKETEVVKRIIRRLKQSMSPRRGNSGDQDSVDVQAKLFLKAPDLFLLRYLRRGEDHPFLNSFKPCALTQFNVNYTGAGTYSTYGDSTPVNIQVRMTFKEINPIYAEDYNSKDSGSGVGY